MSIIDLNEYQDHLVTTLVIDGVEGTYVLPIAMLRDIVNGKIDPDKKLVRVLTSALLQELDV